MFQEALKAIEYTNDVKLKLEYFGNLAYLYKVDKMYSEAEKLNLQIMDLAEQEKHDEQYYYALSSIVAIKKDEGKDLETNEFAKRGIEKLKQSIIKAQSEKQRALLLSHIASLYSDCGNYLEGKKYYLLAKEVYSNLSNKTGVISCLGGLADIYHLSGEYENEIATHKEIKYLTEGSHNYYDQALSIFNLCIYEIAKQNLQLAKQYFDEVEYLNSNYSLKLENELVQLESLLNSITAGYTKPERSIKELIDDFYTKINIYPDERIQHLRFWIFVNGSELLSNFRYLQGLKFLIFDDDTQAFLSISSRLNGIGEFFLQSFATTIQTGNFELLHYPKKWPIPKGVSVYSEDRKEKRFLFKSNRFTGTNRYTFILVDKFDEVLPTESKAVLEERGIKFKSHPGNMVFGHPLIFPKTFEDLLLQSSADEVLKKKIFFNIDSRNEGKGKFSSDLNFSKKMNFIPVYIDILPKSDNVFVLEIIQIELPVFSEELVQKYASEVNKIKNLLIRFCQNIDNPSSFIQNLKIDINETLEGLTFPKLDFMFHVLEFVLFGQKQKIVALVLRNGLP
jgi:tetratricopeptide (TPR) repeat protein